MSASYPKVLDSGSDTWANLWRYVKGSVICVMQLKGFVGTDASTWTPQTMAAAVPNTNNALTAYSIPTTISAYGGINSETIATHWSNSSASVLIKEYFKSDLKLMSDMVREVNFTRDTAVSATKPNYNARGAITTYIAAA